MQQHVYRVSLLLKLLFFFSFKKENVLQIQVREIYLIGKERIFEQPYRYLNMY